MPIQTKYYIRLRQQWIWELEVSDIGKLRACHIMKNKSVDEWPENVKNFPFMDRKAPQFVTLPSLVHHSPSSLNHQWSVFDIVNYHNEQ